MTDTGISASLFDDNPTVEDLLGFDGVAAAVVRVLRSGGLDPVTVGVHGPWGGGKSTVLNLIDAGLDAHPDVLVVRIDPWEFEDSQDVRGTLIGLVLNALQTRLADDDAGVDPGLQQKVIAKLNDLRKRIAWGRVATVLVTSAVTLTPDIKGLVEALTPAGPTEAGDDQSSASKGPGQSMAGFRHDFANLMKLDLGFSKVVVLVDDLDRCLPPAIVGTLEAIKLFLSVEKMAFVLAADEDLVRAGIDAHLGGLADGDFAARYMEKIVQIPVSLPVLSKDDAEAYIALLLTKNGQMDGAQLRATVERARDRRRQGLAPYVVSDGTDGMGPDPTVLTLAATAATGLSADMWQTPRAVKRFLNNLAVREHITSAAGASLPLEVLVKMYVLELRHLKEFSKLAALSATERTALLEQWEGWARDRGERPGDVEERTRAWAATEPELAKRGSEIDRYLSLAATLRADVRFGGAMDPAQRALVEALVGESDVLRGRAVHDTLGLGPDEQDVVVRALGDQVARLNDPESCIRSLVDLSDGEPRLHPSATEILQRPAVLKKLEPHHIPFLSSFKDVLTSITTTPNIRREVVKAATEDLASG